jgi:hypothetical protein
MVEYLPQSHKYEFTEGTEAEYAAMEAIAPRFFEDLAQVFNEFAISAAS